MDEDEQEDLLVNVSDSEDSLEESDAYLDLNRKVINGSTLQHGFGGRCNFKKRVEFVCTGIICLLSSTTLLILLPLYGETSSQVADIYPSIVFCSATTALLSFFFICLRAKFRIFSMSSFKKNVIPPISLRRMFEVGSIQAMGGMCIVYALDCQRVLCHLQDPIKGFVLVFSMVYYFCFSKKIMGLQKIFCATTIVIGLFVSVDYALCDEFHCRGYEREKVEDDGGHWSRAAHFLWAIVYILGLAIWSLQFSLLEGQIVGLNLDNQLACSCQTSRVDTISCVVSSQSHPSNPEVEWDTSELPITTNELDLNSRLHQQNESSFLCDQTMESNTRRSLPTVQNVHPSALTIVFWVNFSSLLTLLSLFWTSMTPIGKSSSWNGFINNSYTSLLCHFHPNNTTALQPQISCGLLSVYGWLFAFSLFFFFSSSYHFLIMCQSSVFTVALISSALPLTNIFWSLFRLMPSNGGFIQWWPNFTPELVCTLLGTPIVSVGLILLCKAHWTNTMQKELCCTLRYHPRTAHT